MRKLKYESACRKIAADIILKHRLCAKGFFTGRRDRQTTKGRKVAIRRMGKLGATTAVIAHVLCISTKTVEYHSNPRERNRRIAKSRLRYTRSKNLF